MLARASGGRGHLQEPDLTYEDHQMCKLLSWTAFHGLLLGGLVALSSYTQANVTCTKTTSGSGCNCTVEIKTSIVPQDPEGPCPPPNHMIKIEMKVTCGTTICDNANNLAYRCSNADTRVQLSCNGKTFTAIPNALDNWGDINSGDCDALAVGCN